ncbi:MAG: hypothetical protein AABW80_02970 [Nanoarchaeota archaeon]
MAKSGSNFIGSWAFLIGVVVAVIFGFLGQVQGGILTTLVVIGLIVGLLNIADKETGTFLISGAVLIIAGSLAGDSLSSLAWASNILDALLAIFVPSTIIVAIKNVFVLARH